MEVNLFYPETQDNKNNLETELLFYKEESSRLRALLDSFMKGSQSVLKFQGFSDTAHTLFDLCKTQIGAKSGYVALLNEDGSENEVLFLDSGGLPCSVDPALPMPIRGLREKVYANSRPAYENNFQNSEWIKFMPEGHVALKNVMFAPLVHDGKTVGLVGLANKPTDFDERDAQIAAMFGEFAAIALREAKRIDEIKKSQAALELSEAKIRSLFETMKEGVCLHEIIYDKEAKPIDYRILEVNPAFENLTKITKEQALNKNALEIYGTKEAPFLDIYSRVAETGKPESFEIFWPPMDRHFIVSAFSVKKGQFGTVFTDITEQKRKEELLRISEEYLSTTLNSIGDAVITTDTRGEIIKMNPVAEDLTGWNLMDAKGLPLGNIFNIFNQETLEKVTNPVDRVLREGIIIGLANHTVLISKDGRKFNIDDSAAPIRGSDGKINGVVLIFRDITEKYQTDGALRKNEAKLKSIFQAIPIGLGLLSNRHFMEINDRFCDLIGYTRDELIGNNARMVYANDNDFERVGTEKYKQLREHGVGTITTPLKRKNGEIIQVLLSSAPVDPDNLSAGTSFTAMDITEHILAEEAIKDNEHQLEAIYQNAPFIIMLVDGNRKIRKVNRFALDFTGRSESDMVGMRGGDALRCVNSLDSLGGCNFGENCADCTVRKTIINTLETGQSHSLVQATLPLMVNGKGQLLTFLLSTTKVEIKGESLVLVTILDISRLKKAEAELQKLGSAIRQAYDGVVITEPDGRIIYVNPSFERLTGYTSDEVTGETPRILKSGKQDIHFYKNLWDTIRKGENWQGVIVNKKKNETLYSAVCSITPILDNDGKIINFIWITRDITGELETQKKLIQAQKMETIGTLAGGIAHDFNNILSPIILNTEMAMSDISPGSEILDYLKQIYAASHRAKDLVKQILTFSRQTKQELVPLKVGLILKEVIKFLRSSIPTSIDIIYDVRTDSDTILADPVNIHQIIMNLCTNSVHAMRENGGKLMVELSNAEKTKDLLKEHPSIDPDKNFIKIKVSDTGEGIPNAIKDRIFDPFFTTKSKSEGTGLGLSVVHGIIEAFSGSIAVESEVGKGTAFEILLPKVLLKVEAAQETREAPLSGTEKILLVDDEIPMVNALTRALTKLGYQVTSMSGSIEALEEFKNAPDAYDLVITDMTMPKMRGDQLSSEIRRIRKEIPVILCTGYSDKVNEKTVKEMDISALLMKPIVINEMAKTIREVLDKNQAAG